MNSGMKIQQFEMQLTATGIAPDLHRLPILIPLVRKPITRANVEKKISRQKLFMNTGLFTRGKTAM
jgi:hypothetical protein